LKTILNLDQAGLRPFRVVTGPTVVITAMWVTSATSGLLQSTIVAVRGTGYWITVFQACTGVTPIRRTGSQSVVLGISFVGYLSL